jgi:hypothetical protein
MDAAWALVLNLHQPPGNLDSLLDSDPWMAREILWALDRIPRATWPYEDVARVHLSLSGSLLETLASPGFQARAFGIVDCGSLLWHLQNTNTLEVLGSAYYHAVLPLIPQDDWHEQLQRWRGIAEHLLWRTSFRGFWPPEMGFCMEMIPWLKRMGYWYVLVDSQHVQAVTSMSWQEQTFRPHIARHGGEEIVVVVRDRDLSNAQESGMEVDWFLREVEARTRGVEHPLVTTASDGDNGGWFRDTTHGFWPTFHAPLMERVRAGRSGLRPRFIHDYVQQHGVHGEVTVAPGAWNTGWHHGVGFVQWTGSQAQQDALARIHHVSRVVHEARRNAANENGTERAHHIEQARWRVLRAETSCNVFWGEAWVHRVHEDLNAAQWHLERVG